VQSKTPDAERIVEILARPSAITVQRYREAMNAKPGHGPAPYTRSTVTITPVATASDRE